MTLSNEKGAKYKETGTILTWDLPRSSEQQRQDRWTRDDPEIRAHLEAYIQAFLGTEAEYIREFEEVGVECWPNEKPTDKR